LLLHHPSQQQAQAIVGSGVGDQVELFMLFTYKRIPHDVRDPFARAPDYNHYELFMGGLEGVDSLI
ncbi:MAG: hypothetical protein ACK55K_07830, partial [Bacteroidota bacterium]